MSLRRAVAAPFRQHGSRDMGESAFVVALSLDRDWFSPDQAKRLLDVAASEGLLERDDDRLVLTFDPQAVTIPDEFEPDEVILQERTTFERVLDVVVDAGYDKQAAVAAVNSLQADLQISIDAAVVLYAHSEGMDVQEYADAALADF